MSLIIDPIQAFVHVQRQQGWRQACQQAMDFLRSTFFEFHRGYVLCKSLDEPIDIPVPEVTVCIRQATPDDVALFEQIVPPLRAKRFAKKIQAGETCVAAMKEQRIVAYVFAGFANTPSSENARLELGPREAYLWAGYALPQYRRHGVVRAVNLTLCRLLQENGYESAILQVEGHNESCLGHCYKMGYRLTDRVTYLKILGWRTRRSVSIEEPVRGLMSGLLWLAATVLAAIAVVLPWNTRNKYSALLRWLRDLLMQNSGAVRHWALKKRWKWDVDGEN